MLVTVNATLKKPKAKGVRPEGRKRRSSMPVVEGERVLLPQHEHFCQLFSEGYSGAEAYRKAVATGYIERGTAQTEAAKLLARPDIDARITALSTDFQTFLRKKLAFGKEQLGKYLQDALHSTPAELNVHNSLATKVTYNDVGGIKSIEGFSKEKAAELLVKLGGLAEPEKVEVKHDTTAEVRAAMQKLFAAK